MGWRPSGRYTPAAVVNWKILQGCVKVEFLRSGRLRAIFRRTDLCAGASSIFFGRKMNRDRYFILQRKQTKYLPFSSFNQLAETVYQVLEK